MLHAAFNMMDPTISMHKGNDEPMVAKQGPYCCEADEQCNQSIDTRLIANIFPENQWLEDKLYKSF